MKAKQLVLGDIVETNGRTVRQNNMAKKHKYPIGSVVEYDVSIYTSDPNCEVSLKGLCTLLVVGHQRDCDGSPLYALSDIAVEYPFGGSFLLLAKYKFFATCVQTGVCEEHLNPTGKKVKVDKDLGRWACGSPWEMGL